MLIGGSIAFYYQNPEFRSRDRRKVGLSNRMKEKVGLLAMMKITEIYYNKEKPWSLGQLATYLNTATESLSPILDNLVTNGLLIRTDADPAGYLPGQSPDVLPVTEILHCLRCAEEDDMLRMKRLPHNRTVDMLYERYQDAAAETLSGLMLKDLVTTVDNAKNQQLAS